MASQAAPFIFRDAKAGDVFLIGVDRAQRFHPAFGQNVLRSGVVCRRASDNDIQRRGLERKAQHSRACLGRKPLAPGGAFQDVANLDVSVRNIAAVEQAPIRIVLLDRHGEEDGGADFLSRRLFGQPPNSDATITGAADVEGQFLDQFGLSVGPVGDVFHDLRIAKLLNGEVEVIQR